MKIGSRGGHTETSPGTADLLDELKEDRMLYPKVLNLLKSLGHTTVDLTPPESYAYPEELMYGIDKANSEKIELGFSIHLNAGGGKGGCEVWISDNANSNTTAIANRILANLSKLGFINRGIKHSPSDRQLAEITNTTMPFLIIEVCFTDVQGDKDIYDRVGTDSISKAIAEGVTGQTITQSTGSDFIRSVQHDLQKVNCLGLGESLATGELDTRTKEAIRQFRGIVDLPDGTSIDDSLIAALNTIVHKPTLGVGWPENKTATKYIQWWVGGSKTGIYDKATEDKVREWQVIAKVWSILGADGVIRIKDWDTILK